MGSHRARHRADQQNRSEELATDLLARLAGEARPRPARRRHTPPRPALDPFATAPFPAHRPDTAELSPLSAAGSPMVQPPEVTGPRLGAGIGPTPDNAAAHGIPAPRRPTDPEPPFPDDAPPLDDAPRHDDGPPAAADAPRPARGKLTALRHKPIFAAVSATVITATAAATATAGPTTVTPPTPSPDRATSQALAAAAAMGLTSPGQKPSQLPEPVAPQLAGGAAVLAPAQAPAEKPGDSPALGATIAARAAADAKAYAAGQARPAAPRAAASTAPKKAARPAPSQAAPVAGNSVGARALTLAKGKLGNPYVWGAAGPNAFDCSGLVVWAYKQVGISLPHSSAALSTTGTPVSKAALQPGDLVFFYSPVSHVGIYAGNGRVLNATQSGEPVQYTNLANLPFHNAVRLTA
jgi:peptidoglycan DL-endopeptidase CwlO